MNIEIKVNEKLKQELKELLKEPEPEVKPVNRRRRQASGKVLIGGMFDPQVRHALSLILVEPENFGRSLQDLMGEAINDLCVKYGQSEPYQLDLMDD